MALSTAKLSTVLGKIIEVLPLTVTISAVDYTGTRTVLRKEKDYLPQGARDSYSFSVVFQKSDFSSVPAPMSTCTISGTTYRILNVVEDGPGITVRLDMGEQYA